MRFPVPIPIHHRKQTLQRKLVGYMLLFAALLFVLLFTCQYLLGSFTGTSKRISELLQFQTDVFERQIDTYFEELAVMSVQLSSELTEDIADYLTETRLDFHELNDDSLHIEGLQERLIEPLRRKLWEADCTGAFLLLDVHVNSYIENAEKSKSGIYLQRNSLETLDTRVLLYRGLSHVGKEHNCMPHRKWRLEFSTDLFPNYETIRAEASLPLGSSFRITDVVKLPGTDQHVLLVTIPLLGKDGTFYGLCGFELNEGYFKKTFAQPSELSRALFCIFKSSDELCLAETALSAGVLDSYYLEPTGCFSRTALGDRLTVFNGATDSYIGIVKELALCQSGERHSIGVLMPKRDYDDIVIEDAVKSILLVAVFLVGASLMTLYFTKRYLKPLIADLELIRQKSYAASTAHVTEINDLFVFLAEQDRINDERIAKAESEREDAMTAFEELRVKYDETDRTAERLAYSRRDEIDPADYETFKSGLKTLTEKEREVFGLYLSGKTAQEITVLLNIRESTLKYHNHNILGKLGVSSRKQMLRYAALMEQEERNEQKSIGE